MKTSDLAINEIIAFEGLKLKPYNCPAGLATIGVGHLIAKRKLIQEDIIKYKNFTKVDAINLLKQDLKVFEEGVLKLVNSKPITQGQFDAMVMLSFNIGVGAFSKSSVIKKFLAGDIQGSADSFLLWNKGGGKVLPGLVRRRNREREIFLSH